jgi:dethiobiotin synthase
VSKGLFITGTGTDVGKTLVTAGILRWLRAQGMDAVSAKPVQTGARRDGGVWRSPDLDLHLRIADYTPEEDEYALMAPYCYEPACSPHLAGRLVSRVPDVGRICECVHTLQSRHAAVLVEGAGGIMVPLDDKTLLLALAARLGFPVVIVALAGLGTINHTLLTIEALKHAGVPVLGVILNEPHASPRSAIKDDNPRAIERYAGVKVLGTVPFLPGLERNDPAAWASFDRSLPGLTAVLEHLRA